MHWVCILKHYPAVIQQLHPARKSATVMFVESGNLAGTILCIDPTVHRNLFVCLQVPCGS